MKSKRIVCTFVACLIATFMMAQKANFQLHSDGNFYLPDGSTYYVISDSPDQGELFDDMLINATDYYDYPDKNITCIGNKAIYINGIIDDSISIKLLFDNVTTYSFEYKLSFQFKDGKIRVNAPKITRMYYSDNHQYIRNWVDDMDLFKKGKTNSKREYIINILENTQNGIINQLTDYKKLSDW